MKPFPNVNKELSKKTVCVWNKCFHAFKLKNVSKREKWRNYFKRYSGEIKINGSGADKKLFFKMILIVGRPWAPLQINFTGFLHVVDKFSHELKMHTMSPTQHLNSVFPVILKTSWKEIFRMQKKMSEPRLLSFNSWIKIRQNVARWNETRWNVQTGSPRF